MRRRLILFVPGLLLVSVIAGALWVRHELRASLPLIDGSLRVAGLSGATPHGGVPVGYEALGPEVDDPVTVACPRHFLAVGHWYHNVGQIPDEQEGELPGISLWSISVNLR